MYRLNFFEFEVVGDHKDVQMFINCRGDSTVYINNTKSNYTCEKFSVSNRDLVTIVFEENFSAEQFQGKDIFKWIKGSLPVINSYHIRYGFADCRQLQFIPKTLLINNRLVKDLGHLFKNCHNLKTLREDLFTLNDQVEDFSNCFERCNSLTSIPPNLFAKNLKATNFNKTFANCEKLLLVPSSLFSHLNNIKTAKDCFLNFKGIGPLPIIKCTDG